MIKCKTLTANLCALAHIRIGNCEDTLGQSSWESLLTEYCARATSTSMTYSYFGGGTASVTLVIPMIVATSARKMREGNDSFSA